MVTGFLWTICICCGMIGQSEKRELYVTLPF